MAWVGFLMALAAGDPPPPVSAFDAFARLKESNLRMAAKGPSAKAVHDARALAILIAGPGLETSAHRFFDAAAGEVTVVSGASDSMERALERSEGPLCVVMGRPDAKSRLQVWAAIENLLTGSAPVRDRVNGGRLAVLGATCDESTGRVEWLGSHPDQERLLAMSLRTAPMVSAGASSASARLPKPKPDQGWGSYVMIGALLGGVVFLGAGMSALRGRPSAA